MNISLAPITSKGMMNATSFQQEVIHGSNHIKPLFRHLPISRQISFVKSSARRVSIAHLRGIEAGKLAVALLILDLSQEKQPITRKGIRLWLFD
jgi:hypothetical protein